MECVGGCVVVRKYHAAIDDSFSPNLRMPCKRSRVTSRTRGYAQKSGRSSVREHAAYPEALDFKGEEAEEMDWASEVDVCTV